LIVIVAGILDQAFGFGINEVLDGIGEWVGKGAAELLALAGKALAASTRPELNEHWFLQHFADMAGVAALLVLPMLLFSIMQAIIRQDLSVLLRSALVHLPLALLLTTVAVELVQLSLAAVDSMCAYLSRSSGHDTQAVVSSVADALNRNALAVGQPASSSFAVFVGGIVITLAALLLWLELVLRTAAIYVAVLFLPLALATLVWPSVSHWCRRLTETLAAVILSKLVIVGVLSLAAAALAADGGRADLSGVISGAALLVLAAFAPYALLQLIPAVEAGAVMHMEAVSGRARSFAASSGKALGMAAGAGLDALGGPPGEALTVSEGEPSVPMTEGIAGLGAKFNDPAYWEDDRTHRDEPHEPAPSRSPHLPALPPPPPPWEEPGGPRHRSGGGEPGDGR
jgi:hypothetical protein